MKGRALRMQIMNFQIDTIGCILCERTHCCWFLLVLTLLMPPNVHSIFQKPLPAKVFSSVHLVNWQEMLPLITSFVKVNYRFNSVGLDSVVTSDTNFFLSKKGKKKRRKFTNSEENHFKNRLIWRKRNKSGYLVLHIYTVWMLIDCFNTFGFPLWRIPADLMTHINTDIYRFSFFCIFFLCVLQLKLSHNKSVYKLSEQW